MLISLEMKFKKTKSRGFLLEIPVLAKYKTIF